MSLAAKPKSGSKSVETAEPMIMRVQSPDLSRLLSISSIIVALVVAGSLALEGMISRNQFTQAPAPEALAEVKRTPEEIRTRADQQRVQYLEQRLALLERQIVVLQTQVSSEQRQSTELKVKVSSLETAVTEQRDRAAEPVTIARAPEIVQEPDVPETQEVAPPAETEPQPEETVVIVPAADNVIATNDVAPDSGDTTAVEPQADTVTTGSVDPQEALKTAATPNRDISELVKPAVRKTRPTTISRTRFGVALDFYKSIDAVKAAWMALKEKHGSLIDEFEPRALPQGTQEGELVYRLMLGPIENVADAAQRCARLTRSGMACKAAVYSGEPLDTPPSPGTLIKVEVVADDAVELPLQPLPDPKFAALPARIRNLVANAPLPRPKPKPSS